jgi:hypothetical protein
MAENNNIPQGGVQNAPATVVQKAQLDATGTFVAAVRAEDNRHWEEMTGMYQAQTRAFGAGLVDFINGVLDRVTKTIPADSPAGTLVKILKDNHEAKLARNKAEDDAELEHQKNLDQINIIKAQTDLEKQRNEAKRLDLQLAESNKDKAEAEARVSERFSNFADRFNPTTTAGPTTGPAPATLEKKSTKGF